MTGQEVSWSLTDDALVLILHAEHSMVGKSVSQPIAPRMRVGQLGGALADEEWLRETAVLRLISTVETYVNAATAQAHTLKSLPKQKPPFNWGARLKLYDQAHSIDLSNLNGWQRVHAGIALRNCLAHGLGNLTELLRGEERLGDRMKPIEVTVAGNRMHMTVNTVSILAQGCRDFISQLDTKLAASL